MAIEWNAKARKEFEAWQREKESIQRATVLDRETESQKNKRIEKLLKGGFPKFARYYFGHLMDSEFAYFQKRDTKKIVDCLDIFAMLEYPREHAKSIIYDVMLPLYLKALGQLTGMMLASANEKKAKILLGDVQAELMYNKRYINDFGEQFSLGNWQDGYFITADGIGFWAFGRGQSPRGTRNAEKRPNYGVFDDIDDAGLVKNEVRVDEALDWILGDFYGAMPNTGSRLIGLGNRINKKSVVAKVVGDVEPDDPKRKDLYHSKVFALENPKTHKKDLSDKGVPAWKERYTREHIIKKMNRQGYRIGLREFFHEHIVVGKIFREEHLPWVKTLDISAYDKLVTYNDPSYKGSKKSDFKSIVLIGQTGRYFDIINVFCRQCSTPEMVRGHYNLANDVPTNRVCRHYMEANFIQDLMLEDYWRLGEERGSTLRIRADRRKKPEKTARIEDLTALTEPGYIRFNIDLKHSIDMQELRNQFLGFPDAAHDDGPDSVEGALFKLDRFKGKSKGKGTGSRMGKASRSSRRSTM